MGGETRRPDDPLPRPVPVRPRPVRRSVLVRVVVTALAVGLLVDAGLWITKDGGPEQALLFLFAVLSAGFAVLALVWAWKRHPY